MISPSTRSKIFAVLRGIALLAAMGAGIYMFGRAVNEHYPVREWMFWVYAKIWTYCILFALACLSLGHLAMKALRVRPMPLREHLVFVTASGVLSFFLLVYFGGLAGILKPWFSVGMPLAAIAAGAPFLFRDGRRVARHVRAVRARGVRPRPWYWAPVTVAGAFGAFLVYYAILSPKNIAFDSHFYHLGIAQQYATTGAIRPFQEAWVPGALPQLASLLYTWAFTLPGFDMFERIVCAAHVEFVVFLFTLAAIPVLVRYLAPRAHAGVSWAALFLFPGIFVYDSGLSVAADHIAAFWAIPTWLAFRRAFRVLEPRRGILLALCLSGAILTKYQAMYLMAVPVTALIGRAVYLEARAGWDRYRRKIAVPVSRFVEPLAGLGAAAGAGVVFTAPHWAKNWVFYGDPLFPFLHKIFKPTRWVPETGRLFDDWRTYDASRWVPKGTTTEKLKDTLEAVATFSFVPHDYPNFHGKVPVFGSLFTLSVLLLPFLKATKRTWFLAIAAHVGVFIWFWTMHQDRYLQLLVPWMAAVTAATFALAWRSGVAGRAAVVVLIAFQMVWGGDAYLIPSHAMTKKPPVGTTNELLAMGYKKQYEQRFTPGGSGLFSIGSSKELPADARVLLHEHNPRLGLWRPIVSDIAGWQFILRYEQIASPGLLHDKYASLGISHIVSRPKRSRGIDCLGSDLRFFDYLEQEAVMVRRFGEMTLYTPAPERPTDEVLDDVAYLGCGRYYERGLHKLADLHFRDKQLVEKPKKRRARKRGEPEDLLADADFAVTESRCKPAVPSEALKPFIKLGTRGKEELWSRRRDDVVAAPAEAPQDVVETIDDEDPLLPP